jgi:hypothetical protein
VTSRKELDRTLSRVLNSIPPEDIPRALAQGSVILEEPLGTLLIHIEDCHPEFSKKRVASYAEYVWEDVFQEALLRKLKGEPLGSTWGDPDGTTGEIPGVEK